MSEQTETQRLGLVDALVDYVMRFRREHIDDHAVRWAGFCFLDMFGCMLAACAPEFTATGILARFAELEGGQGKASLVGRPWQTSATAAALFNGTLGYYADNEPRHTGSVSHILPCVVPAALAIAEEKGASGEDFLVASVVGIEVGCRVAGALDPKALYARGFHPTSVGGVFGAAAAAGHMLGLNRIQWGRTLGLAAQQACGLLAWVDDPTEHSRPLSCGFAARNGLSAARLAFWGCGGPPDPFEGKYSIFESFSGTRKPELITGGGAEGLAVGQMAAKRHVSCGFLHAGLDALLDLMKRESLTIGEIDAMDLRLATSPAKVVDNSEIRSHNAQYILSACARYGRITTDDILTDKRSDPEIARLSRNVRVIYDHELEQIYPKQFSSIITVTTREGRRLENRVDYPKGWPQNPLTDEEWLDKYMYMATQTATEQQARRIADLTLNLNSVSDVRQLGEALALRYH